MIRVALVCVVLGMAGISAGVEDPPAQTLGIEDSSELPETDCLKAIRRARIAIRLGGSNSFDDAVKQCEGRFEVIHEALALARIRGDDEAKNDLIERLARYFETNPGSVPLVAVERAILDYSLEEEELVILRDSLESAAAQTDAGPEVWRAYAVISGRIGDFETARVFIGKILAISPSPVARWAAVDLDRRLERWSDIVKQLELLAVEDEVMARVAELQLVEAYARVGRLDDALSIAESLLEVDDLDAGELASDHWTVGALTKGAWALYDAGKLDLARSAFEEVLNLDPDRDEVEMALRLLYGSVDARREYARETEQMLDQDEDPEVLFEEGTQRLAVGDAAGAVELLRRAAEALPEHEVAWSNYGVAALRLERWSEAAVAFERAVELGNDDPGMSLNLGTALVRADQCEKGLRVLDRLVGEHPEMWQAQYWRWSCLQRDGRGEEAAAALHAYQAGRERDSN